MAIINTSSEFIFVHIPKAAGTSVNSILSRYSNYCDLEIGGTSFGEEIQPAYRRRFGLSKHSTAAEIKSIVGDVVWSKSFTFSFVRNPFERCLSTFRFLRGWEGLSEEAGSRIRSFRNFEDYVLSGYWDETPGPDRLFRPQAFWLRASPRSDDLIVDFVGRVETIQKDLSHIVKVIGVRKFIDSPLVIPRLNESREEVVDAFKNDAVVEAIVQRYAVDFRLFGYSCDPSPRGMAEESGTA